MKRWSTWRRSKIRRGRLSELERISSARGPKSAAAGRGCILQPGRGMVRSASPAPSSATRSTRLQGHAIPTTALVGARRRCRVSRTAASRCIRVRATITASTCPEDGQPHDLRRAWRVVSRTPPPARGVPGLSAQRTGGVCVRSARVLCNGGRDHRRQHGDRMAWRGQSAAARADRRNALRRAAHRACAASEMGVFAGPDGGDAVSRRTLEFNLAPGAGGAVRMARPRVARACALSPAAV